MCFHLFTILLIHMAWVRWCSRNTRHPLNAHIVHVFCILTDHLLLIANLHGRVFFSAEVSILCYVSTIKYNLQNWKSSSLGYTWIKKERINEMKSLAEILCMCPFKICSGIRVFHTSNPHFMPTLVRKIRWIKSFLDRHCFFLELSTNGIFICLVNYTGRTMWYLTSV